jgi:hypothetical protein
MQRVARRIEDREMLRLIKMWLKVPVEERDENGNRKVSGGQHSTCGTPQGGVISPLLANLYMNRFLKFWRITGRGEAFRAATAPTVFEGIGFQPPARYAFAALSRTTAIAPTTGQSRLECSIGDARSRNARASSPPRIARDTPVGNRFSGATRFLRSTGLLTRSNAQCRPS